MPVCSAFKPPAELRVANCQLHGVLVYVLGQGVLLTGDSGVGKTACAVELLRRGWQLVADDAVRIFQLGEYLTGRAPDATRGLMNIRGNGIRDVTELIGYAALRDECQIDLCVEMGYHGRAAETQTTLIMQQGKKPIHYVLPGSPGDVADTVEEIVSQHTRHSLL